MNLYQVLGAALAVLALALPALIIRFRNPEALDWMRPKGSFLRDLVASELGVTITYLSKFKNVNTTTAPTGAEASQLPCQVAQVFMADTDTEAIVVHNWGILMGPSFATFGWPIIIMNKILGAGTAAEGGSLATNFTFGLANSNQVYIEKAVGAAGGTFLVYLFLPSSFLART
jgi:hypothetical protein